MNFKKLCEEDTAYRIYHAIVSLIALREEKPISITRIDTEKHSSFIFCTETKRHVIRSRIARVLKVDGAFFTSWIENDFGNIDFHYMECE